jgi:hypothetical protein
MSNKNNTVPSNHVTCDDFSEFWLVTKKVEFPLSVEKADPIKTSFYIFHSKETDNFC